MRAHVTYTDDGRITSIGLGEGLLADDGSTSGEFELPADFPSLDGPDAEEQAVRALARLTVTPGSTTLQTRT
jgi:hypothetical protein